MAQHESAPVLRVVNGGALTPAALGERIDELVLERQRLRNEAPPYAELELNRLELGRLQRELSHALLAEAPRAHGLSVIRQDG